MQTSVDNFLLEGCLRCPLGGTPQCKVHQWHGELTLLREILLESGLEEMAKWGAPCYTYQGKNVILLAVFKEYCAISFLKGALLQDHAGILRMPGENTQSARIVRFTSPQEVKAVAEELKTYIYEAIELEKAGVEFQFKKPDEHAIPEELLSRFAEDPVLKAAFSALTPGRQRGYLLHFSAPKQAQTRLARIDKCRPKILQGKGMQE